MEKILHLAVKLVVERHDDVESIYTCPFCNRDSEVRDGFVVKAHLTKKSLRYPCRDCTRILCPELQAEADLLDEQDHRGSGEVAADDPTFSDLLTLYDGGTDGGTDDSTNQKPAIPS
jgi:hypothetical protein